MGQLDIAVTIADHPARRKINLEILRGAVNQAGLGLAAIAIEAIGRLAHGRMMRAVVDGVQVRTLALKLSFKYSVHGPNQVFRKVAARDARLIRYQNSEPARFVQ